MMRFTYLSTSKVLKKETSSRRSKQLVDPIKHRSDDGDVSAEEEAKCHGGVEMAAGNVSRRYHHRHNQRGCHRHSKQSH